MLVVILDSLDGRICFRWGCQQAQVWGRGGWNTDAVQSGQMAG